MTLNDLIDMAATAAGGKGPLAREMNKHPARISEWTSGKHKPDASEIAFMAKRAGLPVLRTVADIEQQLDSRYAEVWRSALGKLTAAGIAATVALVMTLTPDAANAEPSPSQAKTGSLYIMFTRLRRFAGRLFGRYRLARLHPMEMGC